MVDNSVPDSQHPATTDLFSVPMVFFLSECSINGTTQNVAFGMWLLSFCVFNLRFTHVVSGISSFIAE